MKIAKMGTDRLFEQHTIKEIQELEKKLRHDIERKKEELRQMVGERYRDLMEAADTITEMKTTAENVTIHIKAMQEHCTRLQQSSIRTGLLQTAASKVAERKKQTEIIYSVAAQMKILMDTPSKIWEAIESGSYLNAVMLYLLAGHTHVSLVLDPSHHLQGAPLSQWFPVIGQQWVTISHFRQVLLQNCHAVLHNQSVDDQKVADLLCCIVLLTDSSIQQVFQEFLQTRKTGVQKIFHPEKHGISAKEQVCELVSLILSTLHLIHGIFYCEHGSSSDKTEDMLDSDTNLLVQILNRVTSKDLPGPVSLMDLQACPAFSYLPQIITDFRPSLKTELSSIDVEYLQKTCEQWIEEVNSISQQYLRQLLDYVKTVKGLSIIREAVSEQLTQAVHWERTCEHLLKRKLSVWDTFLRPVFVTRVKSIISNHLEAAFTENQLVTQEVLRDLSDVACRDLSQPEIDHTAYIWTESASDLDPNLGWIPHHQRQLWDGGTLGMKSQGYTPRIQSICSQLDSKLQSLLEDLAHFTSKQPDVEGKNADKYIFLLLSPPTVLIDVQGDNSEIHTHLKEVSESSLRKFLLYTRETIDSSTVTSEPNVSVWPVFLGHLCRGLTELCPHARRCIMAGASSDIGDYSTRRISMPFSVSSTAKEDPDWFTLKTEILEHSDSAFRVWSNHIINKTADYVESALEECSASALLKMLLQWDNVEIEEESEEGGPIKSTICIPLQVSAPLQTALFDLCCNINKIGGHSLNRSVRQEMTLNLLSKLLDIYHKAANVSWEEHLNSPHLAQTRALQMLFDVQFLMLLIGPREAGEHPLNNLAHQTITHLESQVDPFDLDVFTPHIKTNLRRTLHRSSLMLGLLIFPTHMSHMAGPRSLAQPNQNDQHNLLPVSAVPGRFQLLPFTNRTTQVAKQLTLPEPSISDDHSPKESPMKAFRTHSSSPNLAASANESVVSKSASFYDRVTAMGWFGGN